MDNETELAGLKTAAIAKDATIADLRAKLAAQDNSAVVVVKDFEIAELKGTVAQLEARLAAKAKEHAKAAVAAAVATGKVPSENAALQNKWVEAIAAKPELADALAELPPAAAATSLQSFGTAAIAGLALALAAIGAIIGALAFEEGGLVPGAPSRRDNRLATVASGEYIVQSAEVERYGAGLFDALNNMRLPLRPAMAFAADGLVGAAGATPVNVAPTAVHIAIGRNERELRDFLESRSGRKLVVDLVSGAKTELGIKG